MRRFLYVCAERAPLSRGAAAATEALNLAQPRKTGIETPAARAASPLKKWASRLSGTWHLTRVYAVKAHAPHLARMAMVNPAAVEFDLFGFTNHMARDIERNGCHCERAAQLLENARAAAGTSGDVVDPLTADLWGRMHLGLGDVSVVVASRLLPVHALQDRFPAVQYHFNSSGTSSRPAGGSKVAPFAPAAPHYVVTQFGGEFWLESNGLQYHPSPATWALGRAGTQPSARGKNEVDLMMHATHSMVPHVAGLMQRHRAKLGISVCAIAPTRMLSDPDMYPLTPAAPVDAGECHDTHHRTNVPLETLRLEGAWGSVRPENGKELMLVSEWQRDAPPQ